MTVCDLCRREGAKQLHSSTLESGGLAYWVECAACGQFAVDDMWRELSRSREIDQPNLRRLCAVVRRDTDTHGKCVTVITAASAPLLVARHEDPNDPLRQMERFIVLAAERAPVFGGVSQFDGDDAVATRMYLDFDFMNPREQRQAILAFMTGLETHGLAKRLSSDTGATLDCRLSLEGWQLAERVRTDARAGDQGFVAMWFHPGMDETFEHGVAPALRATGYNPYRVDRAASPNKIDDDIIANIRKSRLIVADLTGVRPNVFYEAGFAHGLGVPFVLTCNDKWSGQYIRPEPDKTRDAELITEGWFKQVETHALDIRNYPLLGWSDPDDLRRKLYRRIHALALNLVPPRTEDEWK
jgi:hypothetical protein